MTKHRKHIRVEDRQPEARARFYCHTPEKKPVSRTVARTENPWHEGLHEAKRSGARHSRGECLFSAKHSTERYVDVCTDRTMRKKEEDLRKESNRKKAMYRSWGLEIA